MRNARCSAACARLNAGVRGSSSEFWTFFLKGRGHAHIMHTSEAILRKTVADRSRYLATKSRENKGDTP